MKIGWWPHEIVWLEAAMTLKGDFKFCALLDIAEMTGRSYGAVLTKASNISMQREALRIDKQVASRRANTARKAA